MKRLTYISKVANNLSQQDVNEIGEISAQNNQQLAITGILLYLHGIFFQILEGKEEKIDTLYKKILKDKRHTDIICLKAETKITHRLFPDWGMKVIHLDDYDAVVIQPVKALLQTLTDSHRILEKYTQPSVINIINKGNNPLTIQPCKKEKVIFFSDISSFSTFAEILPVDDIVKLVNDYFTIVSRLITQHDGEVIKFIGDCVMASFEAHQADNAIEASLAILNELQTLRETTDENDPLKLLYTGIGIAYGEVIEGNVGSTVKMDYTLLGDAVNVASRLEALTRHLPYTLAFSKEIKDHCQKNWDFINLGTHKVKGKQISINIYSIDNEITQKSWNTLDLQHYIQQKLANIVKP